MGKCMAIVVVVLLHALMVLMVMVVQSSSSSSSETLSPGFYDLSCPNASAIVREVIKKAIAKEPRMAASLLRLHFHDCAVQGCDGSILLDDPQGEKTSGSNNNSIRGFEVVDEIKAALENVCPATVSCADILALSAEASVVTMGGPSWPVWLGRRDSTTFAPISVVTQFLMSRTDTFNVNIEKFANIGLSIYDAVVLTGSHTIGNARCVAFEGRLYDFNGTGNPDPTLDYNLLLTLQAICPKGAANANSVAFLDQNTSYIFDNKIFNNILQNRSLLQTDQDFYSTPGSNFTASLVEQFSKSQDIFFKSFGISMIKMGNISPLTGSDGEIRLNCRKTNS